MNHSDNKMLALYRNNFLHEVEANIEQGDWVKMCMQCGVCSGSCPLGDAWTHPPQEIFMLIRAGQRDEVLKSDSMWMCTSCYNCIVRCPRNLPITHIIHGLANYAHRLGMAPKTNPTRRFAKIFWDNISKTGRVNEVRLSFRLYFMNGFITGLKRTLEMSSIGLGLVCSKRLNPVSILQTGGIVQKTVLRKMLKRAHEIEDKRKGFTLK